MHLIKTGALLTKPEVFEQLTRGSSRPSDLQSAIQWQPEIQELREQLELRQQQNEELQSNSAKAGMSVHAIPCLQAAWLLACAGLGGSC